MNANGYEIFFLFFILLLYAQICALTDLMTIGFPTSQRIARCTGRFLEHTF